MKDPLSYGFVDTKADDKSVGALSSGAIMLAAIALELSSGGVYPIIFDAVPSDTVAFDTGPLSTF